MCIPSAAMLQVLTDLCQITEGLLWLQRVRQQVSVADDSRPAPEDRDGDASAQQQQKIAAALAAVPQYCCCADLMQKATPELLRLVLSFSDKDISRLFVDTFTEVLTLMELSSRPAAAAPAQGAPASTQGPAHPVPESELQDAIDRFFGILLLAFACQPMPLFNAACINHRTGQQVEPPAHHWMVSQSVGVGGCGQHGLQDSVTTQASDRPVAQSCLHASQDLLPVLCAGCYTACGAFGTASHVPWQRVGRGKLLLVLMHTHVCVCCTQHP